MAVYYVASKLSFVACKSRCISQRRNRRNTPNSDKSKLYQDDDTNWTSREDLIKMGLSTCGTIVGSSGESPEVLCDNGTGTGKATRHLADPAVAVSYNDILSTAAGVILNGPLEALMARLLPENHAEPDPNFVFSFLLSSRIFIPPHEMLAKLIESVPENDESLERMVGLVQEWTRRFPYDFRGEEMMSLVKHIVARCESKSRLADSMSEILSALLIKLTTLSRHEEDMKANKKPLDEPRIIEWPSSSKLAQLLCHVEKKFARHIGPEEFVQCSPNLIREQSNYDVPAVATLFASSSNTHHHPEPKKKTCNLENYFEWSNRLRLLVANEILQCTNESDRTSRIELWSSVAQHCLLVGNYNSATSILEPICRLQAVWKRFISLTNQQQLDCMFKHIENSQNLNLWTRQTESSTCGGIDKASSLGWKQKRIQIVTPNSSPPPTHRHPPESSISKVQTSTKPRLEWVVLPVFVDIVKLALKAREDCSVRLPNGSINFYAFSELAAIVSAFTFHMSNVPIPASSHTEEFNYLVNHILTCPLRSENELFAAFEKEATKIESYYDVP